MIVFVYSIGSLWQEKVRTSGYTTVWNTTGVDDGKRLRSRAKVFGQVAFGCKARLEVGRFGGIPPSMWLATGLTEHKGIRRVQLIVRVSPSSKPDRYLVTVTERLVGPLTPAAPGGVQWSNQYTAIRQGNSCHASRCQNIGMHAAGGENVRVHATCRQGEGCDTALRQDV